MEDDENTTTRMEKVKLEDAADSGAHLESAARASTSTPKPRSSEAPSPASLDGTKSQSDSVGTPNSTAKPARSSRKSSQKPTAREVPLYTHLPDVTDESCQTFQVIPDCLYGSKHLGSTDNDSLDCDCREEWRTSRTAGPLSYPYCPWIFLIITSILLPFWLFLLTESRRWREFCLWRRFRLHQSRDQDGM